MLIKVYKSYEEAEASLPICPRCGSNAYVPNPAPPPAPPQSVKTTRPLKVYSAVCTGRLGTCLYQYNALYEDHTTAPVIYVKDDDEAGV
ncbi:MAG: hypothetical protein AAFV33_14980 [Chloroflexota bacterium]